jgi:hypothetical protein
MGGIGRLGFTLDGVRFGLGMGIVTATKLRFTHLPLPEGMTAEPGPLWGVPFEGYLGYTIGDPDEVRGIVELRGALTILQTRVSVHDATLGSLGDTPLNAYLASLELRAGVRVPLENWLYLETGIGISPPVSDVFPERGSLFVALGLPVPTVNAF